MIAWKRKTPHDPAGAPMILIIGTADWNQAIATNQHYMARELSAEFSVIFSESLGLRRPELTGRDVNRMFRRLLGKRTSAGGLRRVPKGLTIARPVIIPFHVPLTKPFNRAMLRGLYNAWIRHDGPRILWTYSPLTYGFEEYADVTVYHCVDLLGEFPQISATLVSEGEGNLAKNSDLAIASSLAVQEHLHRVGFSQITHWPNVADVSTIKRAQSSSQQRVSGRAVFAGNFSDRKVDFQLLHDLLDKGVDLHLAGPISEGGGSSASLMKELIARGASYHGLLSLDELAKLYWTCSVGLIPYQINSYTRGVNPLKTFEYLAAGLRVVSTAVPAVDAVPGHVNVATESAGFVSDVLYNGECPSDSELRERRLIAENNSWDLRGKQACSELNQILERLSR